ncbi:LysR substrate-binding domain-containing protein [Shimia litoralis]|nr:LysR substrate-binding domain-containing protein [Shimia litoralis]
MISRRFAPPTSWLLAFETVARRGSVTDAAHELDLTQGAVSRQIQKLEGQVGVALFQREGKRLVLTPQGALYVSEIRTAITQIMNATIALKTNPEGGVLNLAILPAFGAHWLAPRLPDFLRCNPGVTLNLTTRTAPFDFATDTLHAAIHFGAHDWPDTHALPLWKEDLVLVVAPSVLAGAPPVIASLADIPRLELETRPKAWAQWGAAHQGAQFGDTMMVLDQFATMSTAAQSGLGAALMPYYLVQGDIAAGRLVTMSDARRISVGAYYLVWPKGADTYPALTALRGWLSECCDCGDTAPTAVAP